MLECYLHLLLFLVNAELLVKGRFLLLHRAKTELSVSNWRASEASETLSGVYKFELVRYIYRLIIGYRRISRVCRPALHEYRRHECKCRRPTSAFLRYSMINLFVVYRSCACKKRLGGKQ